MAVATNAIDTSYRDIEGEESQPLTQETPSHLPVQMMVTPAVSIQ